MTLPNIDFFGSNRKSSLFHIVRGLYQSDDSFRGLVDFAMVGAIVLLFLDPSPRQLLSDVTERATSSVRFLLTSQPSERSKSDPKPQVSIDPKAPTPVPVVTGVVTGNTPHVVRTVPITASPTTPSVRAANVGSATSIDCR